VLYVLGLKKNWLLVSVSEDMGFSIIFKEGQVLIRLEGATLDITVSIGVREGNLYKL
jgi:hypothetical protein